MGFGDQSDLVEQFVSLQRELFVPAITGLTKGQPRTFLARGALVAWGFGSPAGNPFTDPGHDRWLACSPVFPRKELIPACPCDGRVAFCTSVANQGEISDRKRTAALAAGAGVAVCIAECVELLDIAEVKANQFLDPAAQTGIESVMPWLERPGR